MTPFSYSDGTNLEVCYEKRSFNNNFLFLILKKIAYPFQSICANFNLLKINKSEKQYNKITQWRNQLYFESFHNKFSTKSFIYSAQFIRLTECYYLYTIYSKNQFIFFQSVQTNYNRLLLQFLLFIINHLSFHI